MLSLIGSIQNPVPQYGDFTTATLLLSNVIRLITAAAGVYSLINFLLAGVAFISSGGNPEAVSNAWKRIYESLIGMSIVALSFAFAGLLGIILYRDPAAILNPAVTGPGIPVP